MQCDAGRLNWLLGELSPFGFPLVDMRRPHDSQREAAARMGWAEAMPTAYEMVDLMMQHERQTRDDHLQTPFENLDEMQRHRVAEYRRSLASSETASADRVNEIDVDRAGFLNEVGEGDFLNGGDGFCRVDDGGDDFNGEDSDDDARP